MKFLRQDDEVMGHADDLFDGGDGSNQRIVFAAFVSGEERSPRNAGAATPRKARDLAGTRQ